MTIEISEKDWKEIQEALENKRYWVSGSRALRFAYLMARILENQDE